MGMPRRPRQHELGDRARIELERRLPAHFVFTPNPAAHEYGIDGTIELFDPTSGDATGRTFYVQHKGTDSEIPEGRAPSVRVGSRTINYFSSLDLPVLIALWTSTNDRLYARWFHTFRLLHDEHGPATRTLSFGPERDEWSPDTYTRLLQELDAYWAYRQSTLDLPLVANVTLASSLVFDFTQPELLMHLRQVTSRLTDIVQWLAGRPSAQQPSVEIRSDGCTANVAEIGQATIEFTSEYARSVSGPQLAGDVCICLASALALVGKADLAARITVEVGAVSHFLANHELAAQLTGAARSAHRIFESLTLAERLYHRDGFAHSADLFLLPALDRINSLDDQQSDYLHSLMRRRVDVYTDISQAEAGSAHYGLANHIRRHEDLDDAIYHYEQARRHNPSYAQRAYYWEELAGTAFLARRFPEARDAYQRALSLTDHHTMTPALLADALLWSGEIERALRQFDSYVAASSTPEPEWQLKVIALSYIVHQHGVRNQQRREDDAWRVVHEAFQRGDSLDLLATACREALAQDVLCATAWYNLAVAAHDGQVPDGDPATWSLLSAVLNVGDGHAWVNALVFGMDAWPEATVEHIFQTAYRLVGDDLMTMIADGLRSAPHSVRVEMMQALGELAEKSRSQPSALIVRHSSEGPTYEEIVLPK